MKTKKELRKEILAIRRQMPEGEVRTLSEKICGNVLKLQESREAERICIYMPINNEAEANLLIGPAAADGRRVYIPKVVGDEMIFNRYEEAMVSKQGKFHIRESDSEDILEPDEKTLIIMPGSVFDVHGHRIGYGGGYYDKYLARHTQCRTIAVCFDFQIVEELPAEDHDICPELIVSEKRCIRAEG